jgi:thiol:disulfide interchange protein DsbA
MKTIRTILAVMTMLFAMQAQADVVAGKDYQLLNPPQPVSGGTKIEVLEFFFYECPHCAHLYGPLAAWEKTMPKDVVLTFVPVIFRETSEPMARTYYALEALGKIHSLHGKLFTAIHEQNIDLSDEAKITAYVTKQGVDGVKFRAAYNSFALQSKIANSNYLVQSYGIRGTPTIAVNGKYLITGLQPEETVRVLGEVIKLARKERSKR